MTDEKKVCPWEKGGPWEYGMAWKLGCNQKMIYLMDDPGEGGTEFDFLFCPACGLPIQIKEKA